tara:strand:- start:438 stop:1115 length:678 start_codon:yes stop_codon:yes gene_type:complete
MAKTISSPEGLLEGLWIYYDVNITVGRIVGGVPFNEKMIEGWIKAKHPDETVHAALIEETKESVDQARDESEKATWVGFKKDDDYGLYIEGRQVKAMLKESASVLRVRFDIAAFKSKVAERLYVTDQKIYLGVSEPTGSDERPIHVVTPMGPRSALKKSDYVEDAELSFTVKALDEPLKTTKEKNRVLPSAYVPALLEYASENGLGADRSQENGKFTVDSIEERR